jgi:formate dehydrogenase iron-sulfur subunit
MAGIAAAALGGLFHYVMKGPNEVSKEVEDEVEKELEAEK